MANQVRVGVGVNGASKAASDVDRLKDKFEKLQTQTSKLQAQGAKGFAIGVGAAATVTALNAVGSAVGDVTGFMKDSITAYRDEETSIAGLTTSLRANVEGWNGNTDAIEATIQARTALGFQDDEQRSSLEALVGAYGDVTKALDVERMAMDLARYSGVDLATATDTLVKVHAGNYRALKALGIPTKDITNETQALAAVMKVTAGQAVSFAQTTTGAMDVAASKLEQTQERLGKSLLPLQQGFTDAEVGFLDFVNSGVDGWSKLVEVVNGAPLHPNLLTYFPDLAKDPKYMASQAALDASQAKMDQTGAHAGRMADDIVLAMGASAGAIDGTLSPLDRMRKALQDSATATNDLDSNINTLADDIYGLTSLKGQVAQAAKDLADLKKAGPDSKSAQDVDIWKGKIADAQSRLFDLQGQLAQANGPAAFKAWLDQVGASLDTTNSKLMAQYNLLLGIAKQQGLMPITGQIGTRTTGVTAHHAAGGYAPAGEPAIFGEHGPELGIPATGMNIIPADKTRQLLGGGMSIGPIYLTVNAPGHASPSDVGRATMIAVGDAMAGVLREQSARYVQARKF